MFITEGIRYRNYQPGDGAQLARLFNLAFQQNGASFIRTTRTWKWRYLESPGFKPEMCHIAEDIKTNEIVGAVYANMIEEILIDGTKYKICQINDVSCHPQYTQRGIAQFLMKKAIEYMKQENCDYSLLTADYYGIARKRIYLKLGYKDIDRTYMFVNFPYPAGFLDGFPALIPLIPLLYVSTKISKYINKWRLKREKLFQKYGFSIEIHHNKHHSDYYSAFEEIVPHIFTGVPIYSQEMFKWQRERVPSKSYYPTYVFLKKNSQIIGAGVISSQEIQSWKYNFSMKVGSIHDLFLDRSAFENQKALYFAYIAMINELIYAARKRNITSLFLLSHSNRNYLHHAFQGSGFFKVKGGTLMLKKLDPSLPLPNSKRPFYIPTHVSMGIP